MAHLNQLVDETTDPRQRGKAFSGPLAGIWRYRIGDHRLICQLLDDRLIVLVLRLGHRSRVYDCPRLQPSLQIPPPPAPLNAAA